MLVRIVKLVFKKEEISTFKRLFEENCEKIRNFEGCEYLELLQDQNNPQLFFTYSSWKNEEALENYRHSSLFKGIWKEFKPRFSERAEAWSTDKLKKLV